MKWARTFAMRVYLCECSLRPDRRWHARRAESALALCGRQVLADSVANITLSIRQLALLVDCKLCAVKVAQYL